MSPSRLAGVAVALGVVVCASACTATPTAARPSAAATEREPLAAVAFLEGAWVGEVEGAQVEEAWSAPKGGVMLGTSRTLVDGRAVFFEFMKLEARDDGSVVYRAWPKGVGPSDFPLVSASGGVVVFENQAHDFPQRIEYAQQPDGTLTVAISGGDRREGWTLRRP